MTDTMTFAPPVAYGVNATGGMNPCFKETMEVLTANHYSGALVFPKADARAVSREAPPPYEAIGMKHNNSPTAHSIGDHAETMPTIETDCGVHFSVFQQGRGRSASSTRRREGRAVLPTTTRSSRPSTATAAARSASTEDDEPCRA